MTGSSSIRRGQFLCFSLLWLAYCTTYFLRKPLGVVKADIGSDLGLSKTELGWCDTALVMPYALVQVLLPSLTDHYGPRSVLTTCLSLAGLTTYLTYTLLSHHLLTLCTGLALTGALLAPCWPAATASLSSWFPDNRLNTMFGLINTATYTGGLGGTALAAALLEYSGWRSVSLPPAVAAVITAALISQLLLSPAEAGISVPGKSERSQVTRSRDTLLTIARVPCVKQLAAAMFSLKFVRYCMAMWLPLYLLEHLGYSKLQAGMFSTVFDVGGIIGSPGLGVILDTFYTTSPLTGVLVTMMLGTMVTALFVMTASYGVLVNCVCLFIAGAANCGPDSIIAGSVSINIGERSGEGRGGTVTSFINGVGNIGGMVEGPIIGVLWSVGGWEGVLISWVGVAALGTLAVFQAAALDKHYRDNISLPK